MPDEKKLLIIGTATNCSEAPYDDPSWDVWATIGSLSIEGVKRKDVLFEIHPPRLWDHPEILEVLNKFPGKVYMQDVYPQVPNSVRYPIEKVKEVFWMPTMGDSLYATNSMGYMFALAYLEGYTHIETYGVYMEADTEYKHQRENLEFYIGYLHAKGVKVELHGGAVLKSAFTYGYEEPPLFWALIEDGAGLENGKVSIEHEVEAAKRKLWMQEGGIKYNSDLRRKFGGY
jgi:hypothetical protein